MISRLENGCFVVPKLDLASGKTDALLLLAYSINKDLFVETFKKSYDIDIENAQDVLDVAECIDRNLIKFSKDKFVKRFTAAKDLSKIQKNLIKLV